MKTPNNIYEQLQRDEGLRLHVYTDTEGYRTIGYGHKLSPGDECISAWTLGEAEQHLRDDIEEAKRQLNAHLPWIFTCGMGEAREGVFVNMCFNMGIVGLLKFKHTLALVEKGDWDGAADEMKNSLWAHQVGVRAERLEEQLKSGQWV